MKYPLLCLLATLAVPAHAASAHIALIHITLKSAAAVQPDGDGFITLASVADLTGGDPSHRTRLAGVPVARAPLSGESRRLTRGDLALKLRQAGCDPETQVVFEGAMQADVTSSLVSSKTVGAGLAPASTPLASPEAFSAPTVIHRGEAVTIYIQSGPLTITAPGTARDDGRVGDSIRVHREGVMTDLNVTVLDTQTVRLEI